jgi:hypothetical protein
MSKKIDKEYFSLIEVAVKVGLSHGTVMSHVRQGLLKTVIIGKNTKRVTKADLEDYIKK